MLQFNEQEAKTIVSLIIGQAEVNYHKNET